MDPMHLRSNDVWMRNDNRCNKKTNLKLAKCEHCILNKNVAVVERHDDTGFTRLE